MQEDKQPSIFETVVDFFQTDEWPVQLVDGEQALRTALRGESGQWSCYARVRAEHDQFCFYSVCSINVPENQRSAVGEFLHRANYGMIIGNFELDFSDGEIRYKTSLDVEGDRMSVALCRQLVLANVMMMDRYMPGIMAVTFGNVSPAAAVAEIEKH